MQTNHIVERLAQAMVAAAMDGAGDPGVPPGNEGWLLMACSLGLLALAGGLAVAAFVRHRRSGRRLEQADLVINLVDHAAGYFAWRLHIDAAAQIRVVAASPSLEDILGHPLIWYQADFTRFLDQVVDDDRVRIAGLLRQGERCAAPSRHGFRILHPKHQRPRSLTMLIVPSVRGGGTLLDGICIDLTDETEAEEERRRLVQQLEVTQRHESLGLLAGGVAHDFNNLLGAIRGNAELLQPMLATSDQARMRWDRLMLAVDRAAGLVRQILAYTGKGSVEQKPLDLEREIRQLKALMKHGLPPNIRIHLEVPSGLPAVLFDPVQFQQVVLNLIVNAAESYQGKPGTVTVALDRKDAGHLRLRVIDTGCGIDAATRKRMFEPYFTTKDKGHGLGLAAVQGIIRKIGGELECESQPGAGTTFTVVLAITELKRVSSRIQPVSERLRSKRAILVVDDDDLMRDTTGAMLQNLGYTTHEAAGGLAGLERLRTNRDDISAIVLDCRMPDLDGVSMLNRLRDANDRIPVILISGDAQSDDLNRALNDQRTRFLHKPFTQLQLGQVLNNVFGQGNDSDSDSDYTAIREFVRRQEWKK